MCSLDGHATLSAREIITLYALSRVLQSGHEQKKNIKRRVAVHLVHLVIIRYSNIAERSVSTKGAQLGSLHDDYMRQFTDAASCALWEWFQGKFALVPWDAYDLFDGRVYCQVSLGFLDLILPGPLHGGVMQLAKLLRQLSGIDISRFLPAKGQNAGTNSRTGGRQTQTKQQVPVGLPVDPVLPFSRPVLDPFLKPVHVKTANPSKLPAASKIFEELTHWHNAKKPLDPKFIPKPPGFLAKRRNQKFGADTIAYSASLTGSSGKIIKPETIVVEAQATDKKSKAPVSSAPDWKAALKEKSGAKTKTPVNKKQPVKGGKKDAQEAAEALNASKDEKRSVAIVASWAARCAEFEREPSLAKRYAKAQKFLQNLSTAHAEAVGSEVSLYLCRALALLRSSHDISPRSGK
jgi:hypothetical protein